LACAKNGQIWSSCSPDFGIQGVVDRFFQIGPQVLIVADHYFYNGKKFNILDRVPEILKKIPTIKNVIVFPYGEESVSHNYLSYEKIIEDSKMDETFQKFEFNHKNLNLIILFIFFTLAVLQAFLNVLFMVLAMLSLNKKKS